MAINLLPADQKSKIKKQQPPASSRIELTGPEKAGKKEPGIKKAGVLMFFKTAFQKPKKDVLKEDREKAKRLPEKKVIFKEKIIIEKPERKAGPKVEFYEPARKPESLKIKPAFKPGEKIGGLFSGLFKGRSVAPDKVEKRPQADKKSLVPEERFPKYKPIKAEKILPSTAAKPRRTEVIKLTTKKTVIEKEEPKKEKKQGGLLWQSFIDWFKGLFRKKSKREIKPSLPLAESAEPKKLLPEKPIVIQREERVVIPQEKEQQSQEEIERKIGKPVEPRKKEELFSYATPLPPVELEEKKVEQKVMPRHEVVKPPVFVEPKKIDVKKKIEEKEKFVPPPPVQKQTIKKSFSLAAWFAKLWKAISGLFKRKKVSAVQEKSRKEEMPEKIEKTPVIEKEVKAPSFVLPPVPPPPKPEGKEEKPEAVSSVVHDKKEEETKKEEQKKEEIPVPLPPIARGTKDQSFRLTRSEEDLYQKFFI